MIDGDSVNVDDGSNVSINHAGTTVIKVSAVVDDMQVQALT